MGVSALFKKLLKQVKSFSSASDSTGINNRLITRISQPIIDISIAITVFYLIVVSLMSIFGNDRPSFQIYLLLLLLVGFYLLARVPRPYRLRISAIGLIALNWFGVVIGFLFFENGMRAPTYTGLLVLLIAYTALLHRATIAVILAGLTLLINGTVILLESRGVYLSGPQIPNLWYAWLGQLVTMGAMILIIKVVLENLNYSLERANRESELRRQAEEKTRQANLDLEQRVAERTIELEESYKNLETFAYTIAHDLRAPLRAMSGFSEILITDLEESLADEHQDCLERITSSAKNMDEMLDGLVYLASISYQELKADQVNLSTIVRQILDELQVNEPTRWVNIKIQQNAVTWGDEKLFRILLYQLLQNAWKFTKSRKMGEIEFSWVNRGNERIFLVRDNGIGFNIEHQDTVFAPFQKLDMTAENTGMGLGITTVEHIVRRHGGQLWVTSKEGQGSTFYFSVPRKDK